MRSSQLQAASLSCQRLLTRHVSSQRLLARTKTTLAVRRETINVWERRGKHDSSYRIYYTPSSV